MAGDDSTSGDSRPPLRAFTDLVKAHDFGDMMGVLNTEPCAREGLLYGLGAGIGAGVLGFFKRGRVLSAGNWGVAGFLVVAVAAKQLCHFQRAHEHAKLQTIIEEGMSKHKAAPAVAGFEPRPDSTAAPAAAAAEDKTAPASKTASKRSNRQPAHAARPSD